MKKYILGAILIICFALFLQAADKRTQTFKVKEIISVYDGDTFRANLNCGSSFFCDNMSIRVNGVDTPEKRGGTGTQREKYLAKEAQKITEAFLMRGMETGSVLATNCFKGKYFRLICNVRTKEGFLTDHLIQSGLGVPYYGGTKTKDWSK